MVKFELHSRNRHRGRYDFPALIESHAPLSPFVAENEHGDLSIDFADPKAVKALNQAILRHFYQVGEWDVPAGYLCPPIPGRADYVHYAADLLAESGGGAPPTGPRVRVLDLGCGANLVYPLIGRAEYGWSFVGTDIDPRALEGARQILAANPAVAPSVELRLQKDPARIFEGVVSPGERFALTLCNPPFHSSLEEAQAGTRRKWKNLGRAPEKAGPPVLNFGGQGNELWCPGGERAFILRMIAESAPLRDQCQWFTTLVSKELNLPAFEHALEAARAEDWRVIEMYQGQKKSRLLAWTFEERGR